ncbi:thialysine N-epsilon-acetyltransferase-like [Epargyreus clarus]|uniref:thialysine N-epsilon-acetyltransferase-like n=1 Tax=Epargyreus clarus TaxID=520877 RepID=UPI003C2B5CAD
MDGTKNIVVIRPAKKDDMVAVSALIQELADFEKMPNGPKINAKVLQQDGFESTPPAFKCLVAEYPNREQNAIVGYALYFPTYSTWEGRAMMLEDLYVASSERRRGIGAKLFNSVAKEATGSGCSRLEFHVLEWNNARAFYEGKGAVNLTSAERWCYYRLTGDALENAANCE